MIDSTSSENLSLITAIPRGAASLAKLFLPQMASSSKSRFEAARWILREASRWVGLRPAHVTIKETQQ